MAQPDRMRGQRAPGKDPRQPVQREEVGPADDPPPFHELVQQERRDRQPATEVQPQAKEEPKEGPQAELSGRRRGRPFGITPLRHWRCAPPFGELTPAAELSWEAGQPVGWQGERRHGTHSGHLLQAPSFPGREGIHFVCVILFVSS